MQYPLVHRTPCPYVERQLLLLKTEQERTGRLPCLSTYEFKKFEEEQHDIGYIHKNLAAFVIDITTTYGTTMLMQRINSMTVALPRETIFTQAYVKGQFATSQTSLKINPKIPT